ncbi:MAG: hypothetical protein VYB72_10430, partial [Planctomycetota bacterium]|nr:hypothetical protein [Planctomycetota bacterium]
GNACLTFGTEILERRGWAVGIAIPPRELSSAAVSFSPPSRGRGALFFFFPAVVLPPCSLEGSTVGEDGLLIPLIANGPEPRATGADDVGGGVEPSEVLGCEVTASEVSMAFPSAEGLPVLLDTSDGLGAVVGDELAGASGLSPLVIKFLSLKRNQVLGMKSGLGRLSRLYR